MEKVPLLLAPALAAALLLPACRPKAAPPGDSGAATASAPSAALSGAPAAPAAKKELSTREGGTLVRAPGDDALYVADEDHGGVRVVPLPLDPSRPRIDVK